MKILNLVCAFGLMLTAARIVTAAQESHDDHIKGMDMPMKHSDKIPPKSALKPAQGASVKIISPKAGQVIKGDSVPLEFKLTKGKIGEHVHAYVDGEMAGMFQSSKGTLNGIKPGQHTLELRVATADHNTELNAMDKVTFTTK
ncbi:MAG TPA: hypothetical protein VFY96_08880 [Candidatus Binatia bacterium]|nr:hypothetical protein [Candidatus Binatia bacterium]